MLDRLDGDGGTERGGLPAHAVRLTVGEVLGGILRGEERAGHDAPAKSDGTSKTETNKEEPKPQPADLTGTWKQTNSNDPSSYMEATISGDTIEVNWIGTDTKSLYWKGTYQAPAAGKPT